MSDAMIGIVSLVTAAVAGVGARQLRVPGGAIVGALVATAAVSLGVGELDVPWWVRIALIVGLGATVGSRIDRDSLRALPRHAAPAVLAAILIILAGIGVAYLLRLLDLGFDGDMLATSPGALSVLAASAIENGLDAPTVSMFHVLRIVLILLSLPLLVRALPPQTRARAHAAALDRSPGDRRSVTGQDVWSLALVLAGASLGGLVAVLSGLQGALIVGTVLGGSLATLALTDQPYRPGWLLVVVQVGLGWLIGALVTEETLTAIGQALAPAAISAVLLIVFGIATAALLRRIGMAPTGDVLATSPGALEALTALADERNVGPVEVSMFHTVRLLLVILSLPLLLILS